MTRDDFPLFLKKLGLNGRGAEIGVESGIFSNLLISAGFDLFFSIDNWADERYDTLEGEKPSTKPGDAIYNIASQRLNIFGKRSKILRMTSLEAAEMFEDGYLDFVYIDADHRYEEVKQDLNLWYPKVKSGGIIAGHDYKDDVIYWERTSLVSYYGVKQAVDEFFNERKIEINITDEPDWKSWWVQKP